MDEERAKKVIEIGNNKIIMRRTDPYGLVSIAFERGTLPDNLTGSYTSFDHAMRDVEAYINRKKKAHIAKEIVEAV